MQALTLENKISDIISPSLEDLGYELVRVIVIGDESRKILQIMLDRADGENVNVDDCEKASRQISAVLDVEQNLLEKYTLEVSSPGIDRPLTRLKDFIKYNGFEAKIEVLDKIDGRRKFRGRIAGVNDENILVDLNVISMENPDDEPVEINFNNIKSAKLVLSDELLAK